MLSILTHTVRSRTALCALQVQNGMQRSLAVSGSLQITPRRSFHSSVHQQLEPSSDDTRDDEKKKKSKRKRRGKSGNARRRKKKENDMAEWGLDSSAWEQQDKEIKMPTLINLESVWKLPADIQSAMLSDRTYFHGRNGMAVQWTPPSSPTSKNGSMEDVFFQIRREQELRSLEDDEE